MGDVGWLPRRPHELAPRGGVRQRPPGKTAVAQAEQQSGLAMLELLQSLAYGALFAGIMVTMASEDHRDG